MIVCFCIILQVKVKECASSKVIKHEMKVHGPNLLSEAQHLSSTNILTADVPLKKLDAYYEMYVIKSECQMSKFAKSKIPGFNPTRGYGYCEILQHTDDIIPQSTIILMNKVGFIIFCNSLKSSW